MLNFYWLRHWKPATHWLFFYWCVTATSGQSHFDAFLVSMPVEKMLRSGGQSVANHNPASPVGGPT